MPTITEVSPNYASINITWEQDISSNVTSYELRYIFTIKECPDNISSSGKVKINDSTLRHFTLENSAETPVEEDAVYNISLTAVNLAGKSVSFVFVNVTTQKTCELNLYSVDILLHLYILISSIRNTTKSQRNIYK